MRALRGPMKTREARYALSAQNSCVLSELGELNHVMTFRESVIALRRSQKLRGDPETAPERRCCDTAAVEAQRTPCVGHASLP